MIEFLKVLLLLVDHLIWIYEVAMNLETGLGRTSLTLSRTTSVASLNMDHIIHEVTTINT